MMHIMAAVCVQVYALLSFVFRMPGNNPKPRKPSEIRLAESIDDELVYSPILVALVWKVAANDDGNL